MSIQGRLARKLLPLRTRSGVARQQPIHVRRGPRRVLVGQASMAVAVGSCPFDRLAAEAEPGLVGIADRPAAHVSLQGGAGGQTRFSSEGRAAEGTGGPGRL